MKKLILIFLFTLSACGVDAPAVLPFQSGELIPYFTSTPSATPDANLQVVYADTPLPTSTPSKYNIKENDTLSQIAERLGIALDDLLAANPNVSPNSLSPGQELIIPAPRNANGEGTPTPVPFAVQQIICHPTADKGLWCFALLRNDFSEPIENVTAQVTLLDSSGGVIASQEALLPLNILPPHESLPLMVFFEPADGLSSATPRVQVFTAIRLSANDPRYLPAVMQNTIVQVDWSGKSAQVNGSIALPAESKAVTKVWIAAVVYDESNRVVGARRWESASGAAGGGILPFEFNVYALAGVISRVELSVEAHP